jgi:hypothetical protein
MTSLELLKEIEAWLSFNTEPSKEETTKLRKSIEEHVNEQLRIHDVVGRSEQLPRSSSYEPCEGCDLSCPNWMPFFCDKK